jgi:hypothetical protein
VAPAACTQGARREQVTTRGQARRSRLRERDARRLEKAEAPTTRDGSTTETLGRPYAGTERALHVAGAVRVRARRSRARNNDVGDSIQFRDSVFEIIKLQKVSTNFKISKNKSCRRAIDLELLQRATYVLINGLSGNVGRSCSFSTTRVTVHKGFNSVFG